MSTVYLSTTRLFTVRINNGLGTLLKHNPYPMWQMLVAIVISVFHVSLIHASALVTGLCNAFCFVFTKRYLFDGKDDKWGALITLAALLIGPLWLPPFSESLFFWTPNTWHSPTNIIIRPFAIAIFSLVLRMIKTYENGELIANKDYWLLAFLMLLSNIAKPSFTQIIIPGLGLYFICMLVCSHGKNFSFILKMVSCFIPCVALTLIQFIASFYVGSYGGSGVEIAWLVHLRESLGHVYYYAILNLFPILIFIAEIFRRKTTCIRDIYLSIFGLFINTCG